MTDLQPGWLPEPWIPRWRDMRDAREERRSRREAAQAAEDAEIAREIAENQRRDEERLKNTSIPMLRNQHRAEIDAKLAGRPFSKNPVDVWKEPTP